MQHAQFTSNGDDADNNDNKNYYMHVRVIIIKTMKGIIVITMVMMVTKRKVVKMFYKEL